MVYIPELDAIMRPSIVTGGKFEGQTPRCLTQFTDLFPSLSAKTLPLLWPLNGWSANHPAGQGRT